MRMANGFFNDGFENDVMILSFSLQFFTAINMYLETGEGSSELSTLCNLTPAVTDYM